MDYPKPYKKGNLYYFKGYVGGKRSTISTGRSDEIEALAFIERWLNENADETPTRTVAGVLALWADADTNPKKIYCQTVGKPYTDRHASQVATHIKDLILVIQKMPLYKEDVTSLTRKQCKEIFDKVVLRYGITYKSRAIIKDFKTVLSFMYSTGEIDISPADHLLNVKPRYVKTRDAISPSDMAAILKRPDIWSTDELRLFFELITYTGLRLSEAACLDVSLQVHEERGHLILTVNRAYKDDKWSVVDLPKFDRVRTIPLCDHACAVITQLPQTGRAFPTLSKQKIQKGFERAREVLMQEDDWEYAEAIKILSPHICRHSLNTNLLDAGGGRLLVSEYLSWTHQEDIQSRYTHIHIQHLYRIADMIDALYESKHVAFISTK